MKNAGTDIGNVNFVTGKLESIHKANGCCTAALNADGNYTAGSIWKILLSALVVFVTRKSRVNYLSNFI